MICNDLIGAIKYSNTITLDDKTKNVLLDLLSNHILDLRQAIADCNYWHSLAKSSDPIERC